MSWPNADDMEAGDVISILGVDHVFYDEEMHTGGSTAWKNNNPGNITIYKGEAVRYGAYDGKHNDRFAIFPTPEVGYEAIRQFVQHRGGMTILDMMKLYAPAGDGPNNPEAYAESIAGSLGVTTDTTVGTLDDDQVSVVADTIKKIEGTIEGQTYTADDLPDDIAQWLADHPSRSERDAADQPFAQVGTPQTDGVKNIQNRLNELGWTPALVVDGAYGPGTAAAAKWFQSNNGLSPDGVFGNQSWIALMNA
jgi:hypothetical protein